MNLFLYLPGLIIFFILGFIPSLQGLRKCFGKFNTGHIDGYLISKKWPFINEANCQLYLKFFRSMYYILIFLPLVCLFVWICIILYTFRSTEYLGILFLLFATLSGVCAVLGQQMMVLRRYKITNHVAIFFGLSVFFMIIYHMLANFHHSDQKSFYVVSATFVTYNCLIIILFIYLNVSKDLIRFKHILDKNLKDELKGHKSHPSYKDFIQCLEEDQHNEMYTLTKKELSTFFTLTEADTDMFISNVESRFGSLKENQQMFINYVIYGITILILAVYSAVTPLKRLGTMISVLIVTSDAMLYLLYRSKVFTSIGALSVMAMLFRGLFFIFGTNYWYLGYCLIYIVTSTSLMRAKINLSFTKPGKLLKVFVPKKEINSQLIDPSTSFFSSTGIFVCSNIVLAVIRPEDSFIPQIYIFGLEAPFWVLGISFIVFIVLAYHILIYVRAKVMLRFSKTISGFIFKEVGTFWTYLTFIYMALVFFSIIAYFFTQSSLIILYAVCSPFIAASLYLASANYARNNYKILNAFEIEERKVKVIQKKKQQLAALKDERKADSIVLEKRQKGKMDKTSQRAPRATMISPNRIRAQIEEHLLQQGISEEIKAPTSSPQAIKPSEGEALMFSRRKRKSQPRSDWRRNDDFFSAFKEGKLHDQDYKLMKSIVIAFAAILLFAYLIETVSKWSPYPSSWLGITTAVMILSAAMIVGASLNLLANNTSMNFKEQYLVLAGVVLYIGYAFIFYAVREDINLPIDFNRYTLPIYIVVYPMLISLCMGLYSYYVRKKTSKACYVLWGISGAYLIILTLYIYIVFGKYAGNIILTAFVAISLSIITIYSKSRLSLWYDLVLASSIGLLSFIILLINSYTKWFDYFAVFSFAYLIIIGSYFISSVYKIVKAMINQRLVPIIFPTIIFPASIYNPALKHPMSFDRTLYVLYTSMGGLMSWSVLLSIFVTPVYYGVVVFTFLLVIGLFISILISTDSSDVYMKRGEYITEEIIKNAWLSAKENYIRHQSATCLDELQTFKQNYKIKKRFIELDTKLAATGKIKELGFISEAEEAFLKGTYLKKLKWFHNADDRIHAMFQAEVNLITALEMHVQINIKNAEVKEKQDLINFIKAEEEALKAEGIQIDLNDLPNAESEYYCALSQRAELPPNKQAVFESLWNQYQQKKLAEEIQNKAEEKKIMKDTKEKEDVKQSQSSTEIIAKFKEVVKKYKETGEKFTDTEFPANEDILGPELSIYVADWQRATDVPNAKIFHGVVDPLDLLQGALGDCYLLSAISVMGDKNLRKCFEVTEEEGKSGAFLLKFFRGGEFKEHVLIDDYFPVNDYNEWVFACYDNISEEDRLQMWPMITEKAYAKFYTSYAKIEGGKVHIALSELTGGIPHYIKLTDSLKEDLEDLFKKLSAYHDNGYMLGAGTPENVRGRPLVNRDMMVQGHAYAILDVRFYGDEMLIKLRNPHGSRGVEWNGEWSDESDNWTEAAIEDLQHTELADGVFWMNICDFTEQFKYIYVCRKFDGRWTMIQLEDACTGNYNINNHGLEQFPQYEVTVTKPSTIFIKTNQSEKVSSYEGKYSLFVAILKNDGNKAYMSDSQKIVSSSLPPINLISVTAELLVDMFYTFPYTFTVVAGMYNSTSKYTMKFYSTDPKFTVRKMN